MTDDEIYKEVESKAYEHGADAFRREVSWLDNPFPSGSEGWKTWNAGYDDASARAEKGEVSDADPK